MRIGMVAMSGIRVQNPELMALGLTLPGFVERGRAIASLPSLGLLTLAALTPDRHEVEYVEIADLHQTDIPDLPYDLVAISSYTAQIRDAYALADECRRRGIIVAMGGLHVTARPEEAMAHCDSVVVGEGEPHWSRLLEDFEGNRLRQVYRSGNGSGYDLNDAPIPRFDLLDPAKYNRLTVQTTRGCAHRCEFCAGSILLTSAYKIKPPEKVLAEVQAIDSLWSRPFIEFADDNSFANKREAKRLLRTLATEDFEWFAEVDVSVADDPELLALMRDSGCRQVLIGFESPRRRSLDGVEQRGNWKLRRLESYPASITRIQEHGIRVIGCFIVGLDGDTPDVFDELLAYVRATGLSDVQVTILTPFPGTPLHDRLEREGRLLHADAWERRTLFDVEFSPAGMTVDELESGLARLVKTLYSADETAARRGRFRRTVRASPLARRMSKTLKDGPFSVR